MPEQPPVGPVVAQNYYWAKPGHAEAVYRHRLHASHVREQLGLPRGCVLRLHSASDILPDVMWECDYPDLEARQRDLEILNQSDTFREVRSHMRTLIRQFERSTWEVEPRL